MLAVDDDERGDATSMKTSLRFFSPRPRATAQRRRRPERCSLWRVAVGPFVANLLPRIAGEGASAQQGGEGGSARRWPLPPRFARSPSPALRGRMRVPRLSSPASTKRPTGFVQIHNSANLHVTVTPCFVRWFHDDPLDGGVFVRRLAASRRGLRARRQTVEIGKRDGLAVGKLDDETQLAAHRLDVGAKRR